MAAISLIAMVLLFLGAWDGSREQLGFLAKLQLVPAILSVNVVVLLILAVVTLLFGRIYCSVICPLGILQDIIARLGRSGKKNKLRYSPSKEKKIRYLLWAIFVAGLVAGISYIIVLLDPYGIFGRMMASATGKVGGWIVPAVSLAFLAVIGVLAWRNGRTWCNTVCPVGTTLGFISRFSVFKPVIDKDKCKNCHACEKKCKAACIDISSDKPIDYSRCVVCLDCLGSCKFGALRFRRTEISRLASLARNDNERLARNDNEGVARNDSDSLCHFDRSGEISDQGRRAFIASTALVASAVTLGAQGKKVDGGLAAILDKKIPERTVPLVPFGSESVDDFYKKCVACQLCISACPNNVLRPSASLEHPMQPEMSYDKGYCRPECTECSKVCPAGAILPITPQEKTGFHIGTAKVDNSLCVAYNDGIKCGNCARHCPVGAIIMVKKEPDNPDSILIPAVDEARCIGCGACENLCPSRPFSAITVNGLKVHIKD